MNQLSAQNIRRMMRQNRKTIRGLAAQMNISQARIRFVREHGVSGRAYVMDWSEAILGQAL